MRIRLLLFAQLAQAAGARILELDLPDDATAAALWPALEAQHPRAAAALAPWRARTALAVNESYASADAALSPGDEVALVPPVSGG